MTATFGHACLGVVCLTVLSAGWAADELVIDDFGYDGVEAVQAVWKPMSAATPVGLRETRSAATSPGLYLPCPFSQDLERAACDRDVTLDLAPYGRFAIDVFVENADVCRNFSLYFRSGRGWYSAWVGLDAGWQTLTISKGAFGIEGTPAGWDHIDGIRLSVWKGGDKDTYALVDHLVALASDVAIVLATEAITQTPDEASSVRTFAEGMQAMLDAADIPADMVDDAQVAAGGLAGHRVAILPHCPYLAPETLAALTEFAEGGGKLIACYTLAPEIARLLSVGNLTYVRAEPADQFATFVFEPGAVPGVPERVGQGSWNITGVTPGPGARVIAWWEDRAGNRAPQPAIVQSENGLFIAHVLTRDDLDGKATMLTALIGLFVPDVWLRAAENAIARATKVGPFTDAAALRQFALSNAADTPGEARVSELLGQAEAALGAARASQVADPPAACQQAAKARQAFRDAYALAHRPRAGEFRAVWEHSGGGALGNWEDSIANLADAGFTAVVPNMWWGGLAHYDSAYLPHSSLFERRGDQIAQCIEAAHKRGIEVHPWKVNWNLLTAPDSFVEQMRREGRLAVSASGETGRWLCASHPDNLQLEIDTMLEVARKYDVDGIHFDYIRYESDEWCYCDGCRERFQRDTGLTVANWPSQCYSGDLRQAYRDWRCEQITRLVRAVSEQVHREKPYLKVSAAVFSDYPGCRTYVGQDWVKWVREGLLDFVCPMDYSDNDRWFRQTVSRQNADIGGRIPFYPGIGASAPGLPPDQVLYQAQLAREIGADGFIIFQHAADTAANHIPMLGRSFTTGATHMPHNGPRVVFTLPAEPSPADGAVHVPGAEAAPVSVRLESLGQHRQRATGIVGTLTLESTYGARLGDLAGGPADAGDEVSVQVQPRDGRVRVVFSGELSMADGTSAPFVVRSLPLVFDR